MVSSLKYHTMDRLRIESDLDRGGSNLRSFGLLPSCQSQVFGLCFMHVHIIVEVVLISILSSPFRFHLFIRW